MNWSRARTIVTTTTSGRKIGRVEFIPIRSYWIPGSWNVRMVYTDDISDQRTHLHRNIRFCITFFQTISYTVTNFLLAAYSGALLSYKLTRKPVQKSKL